MSAIQDSFLGVAEETTYGTAVAPARFLEMPQEGIEGKYERIDSGAFRAGQRVLHKDRFQPNPKGAEGDLTLEVVDSGFGLLFKHALGTIASGAPSGGFTTHTATVADLAGKSLTAQVGRVDSTGVLTPFTYEGGKVKSWELSNAVDGVLMLKLSMDFEKETIGAGAGAYALATPTYPAAGTTQLFTFVSCSVTIGGTDFGVSDISIKGDNKLKTDRWFSSATGQTKREPKEEGLRQFTMDLKGEFDSLTHINRVASLTAAGAVAAVTATWSSPQGGQVVVTLPAVRFDEGAPKFDGAKISEQPLKCVVLWDGSTSPVSVAYKTKDATP